jgi:hypothetical protein
MLDKAKISRNSETDSYIQLANDLIVLANRDLSVPRDHHHGADQTDHFHLAH